MSQLMLMRLWYLPHRRPAEALASLLIRAVSPECSLFTHMKYGSRQRVRPNIRHLVSLDDERYHNFMKWLKYQTVKDQCNQTVNALDSGSHGHGFDSSGGEIQGTSWSWIWYIWWWDSGHFMVMDLIHLVRFSTLHCKQTHTCHISHCENLTEFGPPES